jgi:hypothetical protein
MIDKEYIFKIITVKLVHLILINCMEKIAFIQVLLNFMNLLGLNIIIEEN